jgi:succinoglycan biosynthesis protein ExoL
MAQPLSNFLVYRPGKGPKKGRTAVAKRGAWAEGESSVFDAKISSVPVAAEADAAGRGALVAYFGPDLDDSVVRRRVVQWRHAGFRVLPLAFSRNAAARRLSEEFVNLGHVMPLSRARRVLPLLLAAWRLVGRRATLARVDVFIARNLDIALLALFARWSAGSSAPLIYEVLDINVSCTERSWRGAMLRRIERWVLACVDLLVVSSPYFATAYYESMLQYRRSWFLFENKIPKWIDLPLVRRPAAPPSAADPSSAPRKHRWRIGLFGYLDDEKSWEILRSLALQLPEQVSIYVRGTPYTNFDMKRFLADVDRLENVTYGGPYRNPEDLADVYGAVDIVWSMDFNFPHSNSKWLLTNGLYEAGFFGKPVLGLRGTAVGQVLETWGSGWCLDQPVDKTAADFFANLSPEQYRAKCDEIARLNRDLFVETDEIERIWRVLRDRAARRQDTPTAPRELAGDSVTAAP